VTAREISGTAFRVGRYTLIGSGLRHSGEARVSARGKIASRPVGRFLVASSPASPSKVSYMSTGHGATGRFDPASSGFTVKRQGNTLRDRVGRDKRNGFSTYQVLCSSTIAYAGARLFSASGDVGESAPRHGQGAWRRARGPGKRQPRAATLRRSPHAEPPPGLGAGWQASPLHFFYSPQRYPGSSRGSVLRVTLASLGSMAVVGSA